MELYFDTKIGTNYKSKSQKIRVMSEGWAEANLFCPCCGNIHISGLQNNSPVADFQCKECGEIFELKTKEGAVGQKINDGAYSTMIKRITSLTNPDLIVMTYSQEYLVTSLTVVPKFFFVPEIIERRKPLAPTARRSGWVGCNILYSQIPKQGKISVIENENVASINETVEKYNVARALKSDSIQTRGWLLDVLNCVNQIEGEEFTLKEMYAYVNVLQKKHTNNSNIEAKIRQQLQFLRDKGFIQFLGQGNYRKLL